MRDFFADYSQRLQLEKLVIGLEEPIFIKDIGEFVAKVDSGNGGFNVIHGEEVYQNGGVIVFKTYTRDGELKQVSKKLLQYINVNIGSGKVEQRPVIELDVKFGDEEYKKIRFSVANRSSNEHKVLICKDFIKNELDALIDVGGKNLSDKGVEVEYITEADFATYGAGVPTEVVDALASGAKKAGAALGRGAKAAGVGVLKGAWGATKGAAGLAKDAILYGPRKLKKDIEDQGGLVASILGSFQGIGKFTDADIIGDLGDAEKGAKNYDDNYDEDIKLIQRKTKTSLNNLLIYKLIDYQGKYYKGTEVTKAEAQNFKDYLEGNKIQASGQLKQAAEEKAAETKAATGGEKATGTDNKPAATGTTQPQKPTLQTQSFEQKLTNMILEASALPAANGAKTAKPTGKIDKAKLDAQMAKYMNVAKLYKDSRKYFYVYYIQSADGLRTKKTQFDREVTNLNKSKRFPTIVDKFFQLIKTKNLAFTQQNGNDDINENFIKKLNYLLEGSNASKVKNQFAISWGQLGSRKMYISGGEVSGEEDNLQDLFADFDAKERKILSDYESLVHDWRDNLYLKYQPLDLSKSENLTKLETLISNRIKELTPKESVENQEAPTTNGLRLDLVTQEGYSKAEELDELLYAKKLIQRCFSLMKDYKISGMPEENWQKIIKFTYEPNLKELTSSQAKKEEEPKKEDPQPDPKEVAKEEETSPEDETNSEPEEEVPNHSKDWEENEILSNVPFDSLSSDDLDQLESMLQKAIEVAKYDRHEENEEELFESFENLSNSMKANLEKAIKSADLKELQKALEILQNIKNNSLNDSYVFLKNYFSKIGQTFDGLL